MKKTFSVILIISFCFLLLSLIPTKNNNNNNNEKINEEREKISLELVRKISNTKKIIVKNRNTNVVLKTIYGNLVEDVISILSNGYVINSKDVDYILSYHIMELYDDELLIDTIVIYPDCVLFESNNTRYEIDMDVFLKIIK